jgi:CubicO group peptidase (beta-lactamase class C family)
LTSNNRPDLKKSLLLIVLSFVLVAATPYAPVSAKPGNNLFADLDYKTIDSKNSLIELAHSRAAQAIDSFYRLRHKLGGFNGTVMVAKDGKAIYQGAFGYGNFASHDSLSTQSPIQLASVSKPFTATAILLLAEQGFFSLTDTLQTFFPEFPYPGMTVEMLLSHRSGLIDYSVLPAEYFGKGIANLTNEMVLNYFITKKPALRTRPDRMFIYCNTNYALLASIVEHTTNMSFKAFMDKFIFKPLEMNNSFVFDPTIDTITGTLSYDSRGKLWNNNIYDGVAGDKGIYSSAEDMLKWDNALRAGLVLTEETLRAAYTPRSLDKYSFVGEKDKNYGYGWRIAKQADKSTLIYHNGFWHGSNNVFARDINDGYTVIVLGNKSNQGNYWTQPVWDVIGQLKNFSNLAEVQ